MIKSFRHWFTLVELIVVITILAILGTIGFISMQGYSQSAREATRISDLATIEKALTFFHTTENYFPEPTDFINITYSGSLAWKQGVFGEDTRLVVGRISESPRDPLTNSLYAYSVTNNRQEFELWAISETPLAAVPSLTNTTYADNNYFTNVVWNYNKQIVTVKEPTRLYILWVPTLITSEITDVTVQDILARGTFSVKNSKSLPASYTNNLPEWQTLTGATSFTPWTVTLTAPLIYDGSAESLNDDTEKQVFADNLVSYYQGSNLDNNDRKDLKNVTTWDELTYVNTLIQNDTGGIPGKDIKINVSTSNTPAIASVVSSCNIDYSDASNNYWWIHNAQNYPPYMGIAMRYSDGSVKIYWNASEWFSQVESELQWWVEKIYCNSGAFAALKNNGSVITWWNIYWWADTSWVQSDINSWVVSIASTNGNFAALKNDGSVIVWGSEYGAWNTTNVIWDLSSWVTNIYAGYNVFSAIKSDWSLVTWWIDNEGWDSSSVSSQISSWVNKVSYTLSAVAALKNDGSVVTWGNNGWNSSSVSSSLTSDVSRIYSNDNAFAALKNDGSVITWGHSASGWNGVDSLDLDQNVIDITTTSNAFAALKNNGSVVAWGNGSQWGIPPISVTPSLQWWVTKIYSNSLAFAALKNDGSVITWGGPSGWDSSSVSWEISSWVSSIYSTAWAFAALKNDGSVVAWGFSSQWWDTSAVETELSSWVIKIYSTDQAFYAVKSDGTVISWWTIEYVGWAA